jgi:hypothetical protein
MRKQMEQVALTVKDGQIWLEQTQHGQKMAILVDASQVSLLVQWLQDAATAVLSETEKAGAEA